MIVELTDNISSDDQNFEIPKYTLSCAGYKSGKLSISAKARQPGGDSRFPWSQRRELGPDVFHSENLSPRINHVPVPLRCNSRTIRWFFDGSGGESQFRISLCNLSPTSQSQCFL